MSGSSIWLETASVPRGEPLLLGDDTEVCIVGAGIAGITAAYLLAGLGKRVILLEAQDAPGLAETGHTTGHLSCVLDDRLSEVERIHGTARLQTAVQSHREAISWIERTVLAEQIDCDFQRVPGYLFLGPTDSPRLLEREQAAAQRIGLACEWLDALPFATPALTPCLRFADQAQFHVTRYLSGLLLAAIRRGVRVYFSSPVQRIEGGSLPRVKTRNGVVVTARAIILTTHSPIHDVISLHTKQSAYTTYALAVEVPPDTLPQGLYWDTADPYHYVRQVREGDREFMIVGGADHKSGQFPEGSGWDTLERWGQTFLPVWGPVRHRWSGQVMETMDGLAFIGPDPGGQANLYLVTGDSGMGLTHGTLAGLILQDQMRGRGHPWASLYDPSRTPLAALGTLIEENVNVARQYLDWFTGSDVVSREQIPRGKGAVLRRGLCKVAIYHDEKGNWYECSAVCPHLGCIVRWNEAESTWDCPCHGSRFSPTGKVIHGPAVGDLQRLASPPEEQQPPLD